MPRGKTPSSRVIEAPIQNPIYAIECSVNETCNIKHGCIGCAHKIFRQNRVLQARREQEELNSKSFDHKSSLDFDSAWGDFDSAAKSLQPEEKARHLWVLNRKGITSRDVKRWRRLALKLRDSWKLKVDRARAKGEGAEFAAMPSFIDIGDLNRAAVWLWVGLLEHYTIQIQKFWRGHRVRITYWSERRGGPGGPAARRRRVKMMTTEEKIIKCQAAVRGWLARRHYGPLLRINSLQKASQLKFSSDLSFESIVRESSKDLLPDKFTPSSSPQHRGYSRTSARPHTAGSAPQWGEISHSNAERPQSAAPKFQTEMRSQYHKSRRRRSMDDQWRPLHPGTSTKEGYGPSPPRLHRSISAAGRRLTQPPRASLDYRAAQAIDKAAWQFHATTTYREREMIDRAYAFRGLPPSYRTQRITDTRSSLNLKLKQGVYDMHLPGGVRKKMGMDHSTGSSSYGILIQNSTPISKYLMTRSYMGRDVDDLDESCPYFMPRAKATPTKQKTRSLEWSL